MKRHKVMPTDVIEASIYDKKGLNCFCTIKKAGFTSLAQVRSLLVLITHSIGQWRYFEISANNGQKQWQSNAWMINCPKNEIKL